MADVKSKNLYELLGNDHDEDSDKEPSPPTKAIDKPSARTTKRNAPEVIPDRTTAGGAGGAGRGGRRGGFTGNEEAFRDRAAGAQSNRGKPTEDGARDDRGPRRDGARGGRGGSRGGRGGTFRENRDDRHSRGPTNEHTKQANQSWGGATGGAEWDDEKAGEAIAQAESKDPDAAKGPDAPTDAEGNAPATSSAPAEEPEPEDNSKSYAEYLAELAAKKLNLGGALEARKPNEGSKADKKWAGAAEYTKEEEAEYFAARERKAGRTRERKEKQTVDIDHRFVEAPGGRGGSDRGGRGGRGRGEGGFRGRGDSRGRGEGRGRGGRGGEFRGSRAGGPRGGRGGEQVNLADQSAFPSLGGS